MLSSHGSTCCGWPPDTGKADDAAARDAAVADFLDRFADIVWVTYRRNMPQLLATPKGETPGKHTFGVV